MRFFNYRLFLLLLAMPLHSFASTVTYWTSDVRANQRYPDALTACSSSHSFPFSFFLNAVAPYTTLNCYGSNQSNSGGVFISLLKQASQECPNGHTGTACNATCDPPNTMVDGQCVVYLPPQPCAQDWSGGEKVWSPSKQSCVKYPNLTESEYCSYMGGKQNASERTVNSNSPNGPEQYTDNTKCVTNADQQKAECVSRVNTDGTGQYACKVTGTYSGGYQPNGSNMPDGFCPSGTCVDAPPVPPEPAPPKPKNTSSSDPCVYSSNGSGGQTCTSTNNSTSEGTANCGTVNGVYGCQKTPPKNNGISITTNVSSTPNADGGTTTTKTDTATTTKCTDIGKCITGSTTTTTITKTNGSGQTTSVTGTCTGAQCPDKNTNPDGDGDGLGDCIGNDCGEGEGGDLAAPELEDVDDYQETTQKFFNRAKSAPLLSAVGNIQAPAGGTAPDFTSDPIAALGGESLDLSFIAQLKPIISNVLSYVMKAVWCFIALIVFLAA